MLLRIVRMFEIHDRRNVNIRGIGFIGTHTHEAEAMTAFARDVLGLTPLAVDGSTANMFRLRNGDVFAVAPLDDGQAERTVGFLVDKLVSAVDELHAAGIETDGIHENDRYRYTHFRAPDGRLYELVEERAG
jgi:hypothetical protein